MTYKVPKPRQAALIPICKPLADLQAENKIYFKGQLIMAELDGMTGLKRGDWDWLTQAAEEATPFNDLPWLVPITNGQSAAMPVKLRNTTAGYEIVAGEVKFTHAALAGITDPVVTCTQIGGELRDADFTHDGEAGTLTIHILDSLNDGDHVSVIAAIKLPVSDVAADQEARIAKLEIYARPFSMPGGGGMLIFMRPANQIPDGWREVELMRGFMAMGWNPDDPDFNVVWTKTGGAKDVTMTLANLIEHLHDQYLSVSNIPGEEIGEQIEENEFKNGHDRGLYKKKIAQTGKTGNATPTPMKTLNPYRVVVFIEPIPTP